MPFCPKCECEYREGFEICSDCDEKLVSKLPEKPPEHHIDGELVLAARFMLVTEAQMAKLKLEGQGIESIITGDITRINVAGALMDADIKLMVRAGGADRAIRILSEE